MTDTSSEAALYRRAEKRANDIAAFVVHALVYVLVNVGLWAMDLVGGGGVEWAYWTTIGWGTGLAIHGVVLLLELKVLGDEWRTRQVERYVRRHRGTGA